MAGPTSKTIQVRNSEAVVQRLQAVVPPATTRDSTPVNPTRTEASKTGTSTRTKRPEGTVPRGVELSDIHGPFRHSHKTLRASPPHLRTRREPWLC